MKNIPDAAVQAFMAEFHQRTGVSYEANIRASLEKTIPHLQPVDVAAVREAGFREGLEAAAKWHDEHAIGYETEYSNLNISDELAAEHRGSASAIRALSAGPAQGSFDDADWFYRDIDPDDNGDTAYEAIVNQPEYSVHLIHSSYRGDSRFVFRAPTLNQDDDDDETLNFATEKEAIAAAIERKEAIEAQNAAPTTEAGR